MGKESNSTESTMCSDPEWDPLEVQQQVQDEVSCTPCAGVPRKLFEHQEKPKDKLVGVIVTIYEGSSYDEMFREVRPTTVPGERISTYSLGMTDIAQLHDYLAENSMIPDNQPEWQSLVDDVIAVDAD